MSEPNTSKEEPTTEKISELVNLSLAACPRCGKTYIEEEWYGECLCCGYPEIYFDSFTI